MADPRPAVLVVDDEPSVRTVVCLLLREAGIEAEAVADGKAAVALLAADPGRFPVVILDLSIPGSEGPETFDALRQSAPGARVILASGYDRDEALSRFAGRPLAGFLSKPFDDAELVRIVKRELTPRT